MIYDYETPTTRRYRSRGRRAFPRCAMSRRRRFDSMHEYSRHERMLRHTNVLFFFFFLCSGCGAVGGGPPVVSRGTRQYPEYPPAHPRFIFFSLSSIVSECAVYPSSPSSPARSVALRPSGPRIVNFGTRGPSRLHFVNFLTR